MFDDLCEPLLPFSRRQCAERIDIGNHERRMMPRTDHILPSCCVYRGFPADGAVDLREQGRRHLHIGDSAMINRRDKSPQIAHHSAAKCHEKRRTIQARLTHPIADPFGLAQRLRFFTGWNCDKRRLETSIR